MVLLNKEQQDWVSTKLAIVKLKPFRQVNKGDLKEGGSKIEGVLYRYNSKGLNFTQ